MQNKNILFRMYISVSDFNGIPTLYFMGKNTFPKSMIKYYTIILFTNLFNIFPLFEVVFECSLGSVNY